MNISDFASIYGVKKTELYDSLRNYAINGSFKVEDLSIYASIETGVEKVYYLVDDITNKLNNSLFDQIFSGAIVYNAGLYLSPQELNMFVEG